MNDYRKFANEVEEEGKLNEEVVFITILPQTGKDVQAPGDRTCVPTREISSEAATGKFLYKLRWNTERHRTVLTLRVQFRYG